MWSDGCHLQHRPSISVGMQTGKQAVRKTVALWSVVGSSPIPSTIRLTALSCTSHLMKRSSPKGRLERVSDVVNRKTSIITIPKGLDAQG